MPLKIIIVGAGIAGLSAGIALRQAGCKVEIFEKSHFAAEIGAALMVTSNGARVLSHLGFSFSAARAVRADTWRVMHGDTIKPIENGTVDLGSAERQFGVPVWSVHRVDLHNELLRLATTEKGHGRPVQIHLASEVVAASADGFITLKDSTRHTADLIVAADGLHSVLKRVVLEQEATPPLPTGLSAFRFLIDTQALLDSDALSATLERKGTGATLLADTKEKDIAKERHIMCSEVQNFVGIHPTREVVDDDADATKISMLQEFNHFAPEVLEIMAQSSNVKRWPLFIHEPLTTWFKGRVLLIGDAAHPMLPFGGQGANMAIEDGGTLGYLFKGVEDPNEIPDRLRLFELARKSRASRVQVLSKVRASREKEVEEELRRYADPPGSSVPTNMIERTVHDYGFDVFKKCDEVLNSYKDELVKQNM
ncbi:hypothetical protein G7Y89_g5306 [Cudoniella acicularis]|uniref:FAD-binding domain-containing protein n=1 Tax=Cudoniella acicularis TaxID=354080 RepID=A0A8H4W3W8_9HELO|nr:hypothetical protein G7Y89_g5306 [Cudoniella acicularis]